MFTFADLSNQQVVTLYLAGAFLTAAPVVLGLAALLGYVHRASRTAG